LRNKDARIQSVIQRDQISEQSVKNRINSQFDFEDPKNEIRLKNCNAIFIKNQGDLSALKNQILSLVL
jgi:dephospho-CoA kinase